jgi:hypothetical protein
MFLFELFWVKELGVRNLLNFVCVVREKSFSESCYGVFFFKLTRGCAFGILMFKFGVLMSLVVGIFFSTVSKGSWGCDSLSLVSYSWKSLDVSSMFLGFEEAWNWRDWDLSWGRRGVKGLGWDLRSQLEYFGIVMVSGCSRVETHFRNGP